MPKRKTTSIEYRPIILPKATMDRLLALKYKNVNAIIGLYIFYYYTAVWQKTNQPKSTTSYTAKGLGISVDKVRKYKKILMKLDLIEDVVTKDKEGHIAGHYIKVRFYHTTGFPEGGKPHTMDNREPNTYSTNKKNSYNTNSVSAKRRPNARIDVSFGLTEPPSFYKKYSVKLIEVVEKRRVQKGKIVLHQWEEILRKLHTIDNVPKRDIKKLVLWYVDNWRNKYVPKIYLAKDVRDKWQGLMDAMKRDTGEEEEMPKQKFRTIYHDDGTFTEILQDA